MKQVDRKFLEEQVRKALKEDALEVYGANGTSKTLNELVASQDKASKPEENPGIFDIIHLDELLIGSRYSQNQIKTVSKDIFQYGWGPNSHVKKAMDEVEGLTGFESFAFKFLNVAPPTQGEVSLTFNQELFDKFFKIIEKHTAELTKNKKECRHRGYFF